MEFYANKGKQVEILLNQTIYKRHAIQTHFIYPKENYLEILDQYVSDIYQEGDIIFICEKIISICQNRIIHREDIKIGFWAKFLSMFATHKNKGGYGVGMSINMQYAINKVGLFRVIFASIASGFTKLIGIKGIFYKIVGQEVSGLDGFYDGSWDAYRDIGIEIPENSQKVCNEIRDTLGFSCVIVDANDFGQVILGKSDDILLDCSTLICMIRDNPAGQIREQTPIILVRKK